MSTAGFVLAAAIAAAMLAGTLLRPALAVTFGAFLGLLSLPLAHAAGHAGGLTALLPFVPLLPAPALGGFLAARARAAASRTSAWARELEDVAAVRVVARRREAAIVEQRCESVRAQDHALGEINQLAVRFGQCESVAQVRDEILAGTRRALGGTRAELVTVAADDHSHGLPADVRSSLNAPIRRSLRDGSHFISVPLPGLTGHLWMQEAITTWRNDRPWTDSDLRLLFTLSEIAGTALQAALLAESIDNEARRDGLTGLLTRKAFEEAAQKEISLAARAKRPLAFALLDLDHFKLLNDTYGHESGDVALRSFAQVLAAAAEQEPAHEKKEGSSVRAESVLLCGRLGGEEFGLLAPGLDGPDLLIRIAAIRQRMNETVQRPEGKPLTFSAGIAVFPAHGLALAELFVAADKALYHAKAAGRDQTQEFRR